MQSRRLGRTGFDVSVIGMGCWQLGGDWGDMTEGQAMATLHAAADAGVTFFDTADVYGDGRSERLVSRLLAERPGEGLLVATKCGRRVAQDVANYTPSALREWAQRSRDNLGLDTLPLTQLHCPPDEVYENDMVFEVLDTMVSEGILRSYGVSVETVAQGMRAIQRPGVATVQVILNAFRLKPLRHMLPACEAAGVGVIARVPLASGLLTGKYDMATRFPDSDHRTYNRHGEAFDVGETFSGVTYEVGLQAAKELQETAVPEGWTLAELALRWCADARRCLYSDPRARTPAQAQANAAVGTRPPLPKHVLEQVRAVYDERLSKYVEDRW